MAKHEIVIHENTGATKEVAPYLGNYVAKETVKETGFISVIAQKSGLPAIQAQAILDGSFDAIDELEREGLVRIHTDIGTICGVITGSFETADAAFDPEKNSFELALHVIDEIKFALADVVPTIIADENLTKLRVDNVMDVATPRPYNLIHGQAIFKVAGYNMELSDEGATVYLQDAKGVTHEVVVDEVLSKQLFKGHSAMLLEGGDYKLVVKSRAGDAGGPLQTAFRKVKYLKVVAPPSTAPRITSVHSGAHPELDGQVIKGSGLIVEGENLGGARLSIAYVAPGGETKTYELDADEYEYDAESETLIAPPDFWAKLSIDTTKNATVTVTGADGADSREVEFIDG